MDDEGRPPEAVRLALSASCPIRAQVSPPRGVLPDQGVVALFPEKRKVLLTGPVVRICEGRSSPEEVCLRDTGPSWPTPADRPSRCRGRAGSAFPRSSPWNGLWNGGLSKPSSTVASRAMTRAICADSGRGALGRTSCKRQVSGSNPLTGSQSQVRWG